MEKKSKNVCLVVLGDIGRSPRMQYHAWSISDLGHKLDIIGYGDTAPMEEIKDAPLVYYHYLVPCPNIHFKFINYVFKTIWQAINLLFLLFIARRPDILLVQNPPAVPALIVCWLFCNITRSAFIIDWHNYAHTIMALNLSKKHTLVNITKKIEAFVGQRADHNFCVTKAMREDLYKCWNIRAITLYDKPPLKFKPITLEEKHQFLRKLGKTYKQLLSNNEATIFTEIVEGQVCLKSSRPALLVSSTSWTEDEDFSILFLALQDYEDHIINGNELKLPDIICVITGRGPLKEYYCNKIAEMQWSHVKIITPWLENNDYPLMLASADLGVCLHTSSSGLDLPMKVVDMFGCGLPVCAFNFKCLSELVQHGKNGYIFSKTKELSMMLLDWFQEFPDNPNQIKIERNIKAELEAFQKIRWQENWTQVAAPVFE